jgi:hypothetical protein
LVRKNSVEEAYQICPLCVEEGKLELEREILYSGYSQNSLAGGDGEVLEQLDDAFITRKSSIEVVYPLAKQQ